jgi:pSer/pThr/pTyr-binding forkhead associated (FHA) protein
LVVVSGALSGREFAVRHGLTIGKAAGCDVVIDDGYTSGQHAQLTLDHFGNCRIFDQESTNGTYVNGVRITAHNLDHGAVVRIGSTELRFLAQ